MYFWLFVFILQINLIIFIIILIIKKKPFSLFFCMYLDDLTVKNAFQLML